MPLRPPKKFKNTRDKDKNTLIRKCKNYFTLRAF